MAVKTIDSSMANMGMIVADENRKEIGFVNENIKLDIDIGDTDDFVLTLNLYDWDKSKYWFGHCIYIPNTEYGGIIEKMEVKTESSELLFTGHTWRGLLKQKIVQPPPGQSHLILNTDLNIAIIQIISNQFGNLMLGTSNPTGITLNNWRVDRYVTMYDAITKFLQAYNFRLDIKYIIDEDTITGFVALEAVPVKDWSDELEYSQDNRINFDVVDARDGINHLICGGQGENENRLIVHLYVQEDGTIGDTQYYTGLAERTSFYDYQSAEDEEDLRSNGIDRLKELQNYKSSTLTIDDVDVEIGDIIGGRERVTNTYLKKPIIGKVLSNDGTKTDIQYKVEGGD